jgi:autotransporter-associated beta strand protein
MNLTKILQTSSALLLLTLTTTQAQIATWIGPASGGEWNTAADWDLGLAPGQLTNVIVGAGTNVSYNLPMSDISFGSLTNRGVLNINTNGFNCGTIVMNFPNGTGKLLVNSGGAMNVTGNLGFASNSVVNLSAGSSVNIAGNLIVGSGTNSTGLGGATVGSFGTMTNNGGTLSANATYLNPGNGSVTTSSLLVINGGANDLGNVTINRGGGSGGSNGGTPPTLGTDGLVIYSGQVTITNLIVGNNSHSSMYMTGGVVTNFGWFTNKQLTGGSSSRTTRFIQQGGLFVNPSANVIAVNPFTNGAVIVYSVMGGTNMVSGFQFGDAYPNAGTVNFTNAATVYVGSGGISSNGAVTLNADLNNGGVFGASADWTSSASMILNGASTVFTFQAADAGGAAHNITLSAGLRGGGSLCKTGSGTLTLNASNSYSGGTLVNAGTLAMGASGSLGVGVIVVGSGGTLDVSAALNGYDLNASQTLSGFGTVVGTVIAASSSTVSPGSNTVTGTLTLQNSLIETGAVENVFYLSSSPTGPGNDFLNVQGDLDVTNANTISIVGSLPSGSTYPLIQYGGNFNGGVSNFTLSGATGSLSNSATAKTIYLLPLTSIRGPTNIVWVGNATSNNWDTETTTNWLNAGKLDFFVPNDNALFSDVGKANPQVNLTGIVTPASVVINTTTNYVFSGPGAIGGVCTLTVSNGTLTVYTTNTYTGATVLDAGVLEATTLAIGGSPSSIGASASDQANLVLNGGTLRYLGGSVSIDRSATLNANSSIIDITNAAATLTDSGTLAGTGGLTTIGPGALNLTGNGAYTGPTTLSNGMVVVNGPATIGSGNITFTGGTLSIASSSSQQFYNNTLNVVSSGALIYNGGNGNNVLQGAWTGSGTLSLSVSNADGICTLNHDISGFAGTLLLTDGSVGALRFNSGGSSSGAQECVGSPSATFNLGNGGVFVYNRNGGGASFGVYYLGALVGGTNPVLRGSQNSSSPSTYMIGGNNLSTTYTGYINDGVGGTNATVGITKVGSGTLTFNGGVAFQVTSPDGFTEVTNLVGSTTNLSYSGPTVISNGVLQLVAPVTLTNSANLLSTPTPITLASATAVLDAYSMGYPSNELASDGVTVIGIALYTNGVFELAPKQSLTGIGTVLASNLLADAGSFVNPGLPLGTLNASQAIELAGAVNMNVNATASPNCSEIVCPSIVVDGTATLTVTNLGSQAGATFQLFSQPVSGFASVTLPTLTGTNVWVNNLSVNGSITLLAPPAVNTNPTNITAAFNAGTGLLTLSWPTDHIGWQLQAQTNSLTSGLGTNWVNVSGSSTTNQVSVPLDPTKGTVFFRMVLSE